MIRNGIAVANVAAVASIALITPSSAAPTVFRGDFTMPSGATNVQVSVNAIHGSLVHFAVAYAWAHYVHEDAFKAGQNIREINSYTGRNPEAQSGSCDAHEYVTVYDHDDAGHIGQPQTGVHHNSDLVVHPAGVGSFLQWCH